MLKCLKVNIVIQKVDVEMSKGKYCDTKSGCYTIQLIIPKCLSMPYLNCNPSSIHLNLQF